MQLTPTHTGCGGLHRTSRSCEKLWRFGDLAQLVGRRPSRRPHGGAIMNYVRPNLRLPPKLPDVPFVEGTRSASRLMRWAMTTVFVRTGKSSYNKAQKQARSLVNKKFGGGKNYITTEPSECAMNRFMQNSSDASAWSRSPTRRSANVLNVVDYGLLAMLLITLVSIGATLVGN